MRLSRQTRNFITVYVKENSTELLAISMVFL